MARTLTILSMGVILLLILSMAPPITSAAGPNLDITYPEDGYETNLATVDVKGTSDGASVKVNGLGVTLTNGDFTTQIGLTEGPNTVLVEAEDAGGNHTSKAITIIRDTVPPILSVTEPMSPLRTNLGTVTVSGVVEEGSTVIINMNMKMVPVVDGTFTDTVQVNENTTAIHVTARDRAGNPNSVTIPVSFKDKVDLNMSQIWFGKTKLKFDDWPKDGVQTYWDWIEVEGQAEPGAKVTMNGDPVDVDAQGHFREEVYLELGENSIPVVATDDHGNNMTYTFNIERLDWTPYVVHVEIAGILLIIGIATGTIGGFFLGKWKQRKVQEMGRTGKAKEKAPAPQKAKEKAPAPQKAKENARKEGRPRKKD